MQSLLDWINQLELGCLLGLICGLLRWLLILEAFQVLK
uniref:Uncharacterized protein n=1 Tax=Brassica campestris TaxID=3711 RepID=A0A3P6BV46_BRACM|nr:unnamed protein product [Brassica rapa]